MKSRIVYLGFVFILALAAVALLLLVNSQTAYAVGGRTEGTSIQAAREPFDIAPSRITSIPYGIESSLALFGGGDQVLVTGHGDCALGWEAFKLRVTVEQESTGARAKGTTADLCRETGTFDWSAMATTNPAFSFHTGEAEACGMVIVFTDGKGSIVHRWCKDVELVE